jgi:ribonuclease BN (tRNA processing enzyme)
MDSMKSGGALSRRTLLSALAAAPALDALASGSAHATPAASCDIEADAVAVQAALKGVVGTKLVLLGTGGGPVPGRVRHMTSNVMIHNGAAYILDFGMGITDNFARTGIPFSAIESMFLTHHHPDHNIEYGPFLVIGWIRGLRPETVQVYGPPPLTQMTQDYLRAMAQTVDFWAEDFMMKPIRSVATHELPVAGPVMQDENVKVTAVLVEHPPVKPAYGYRFDFPDRSIVFSGDTVPLEAVANLAGGADVLVHEAMYMPAVEEEIRYQIAHGQHVSVDTFKKHMLASHSPVEAVGRIAQAAGVKTLVLYHLTPSIGASDDEWTAAAAKYFKGEIIIGHDLRVV